jgi:hypothetical protein
MEIEAIIKNDGAVIDTPAEIAEIMLLLAPMFAPTPDA